MMVVLHRTEPALKGLGTGAKAPTTRRDFVWDDALLLEDHLTDDERMVRDATRAYCQEKLNAAHPGRVAQRNFSP